MARSCFLLCSLFVVDSGFGGQVVFLLRSEKVVLYSKVMLYSERLWCSHVCRGFVAAFFFGSRLMS